MKIIPYDQIPNRLLLEPGVYELEIGQIVADHSQKTSKLMYVVPLTAVEPVEMAGLVHTEYFVIGVDGDLEADDPQTWRRCRGAIQFKRLSICAGIEATGEVDQDEWHQALQGQHVLGLIEIEKQTDGDYAGQEQNRVRRFYALGEQQVGLNPNGGSVGRGAAPARRPAAPSAAAPAPRAAPQPAPAPAPAPTTRRTSAKPAAPAATKAEPTALCGMCDPPQEIPKSQYTQHVNEQHPV